MLPFLLYGVKMSLKLPEDTLEMSFLKNDTAANLLNFFMKHILASCVLFILSILLGTGLMVLTVMPTDLRLINILLTDIKLMALNILPLFVIMTAVYYISGRVWIGFLTTGTLFFIVAEINRFKLFYRDDPFVFEDVTLFKEAGKLLESYRLFLDAESVIFLIALALGTVLCFFMSRYFRFENIFGRVLGFAAAVTVLSVSFNSLYFKNDSIYNELWHEEFGSVWKVSDSYMSRGVVYSFIRSMSISSVTEPYGYNEEEAGIIYGQYEDIPLPEDKRVHIISIMLEAFGDFGGYDNIEFNEDPYYHFRQLQDQSYSGKLFTNTFGANTIQTERAFLMGASSPNVFKKNTLSYVRYFKDNGYYTEAMHPYYGWFYDRNYINSYIGFDSYLCYENFFRDVDYSSLMESMYYDFLSDIDFYEYIKAGYEKAVSEGKKYFNFSVTYQNHGPYPAVSVADKEILKKNDGYAQDLYDIANNYFFGVSRTDLGISRIRQFVDEQSEPVVLILFGDHKPALGDEVYLMLGINTDLDTVSGAENYYTTPYVFYANEAAKETFGKDFIEEGTTISPMFLMNELFDYAGLRGSAYMNYMSLVKKSYDVINPAYCAVNGEFILRNEIDDNTLLYERQYVEYYMKNISLEVGS